MPIVILLADPARAKLDWAMVMALCNAWSGARPKWLNSSIAAEFSVKKVPLNHVQVWKDMQALDVDLAIVPDDNRRKAVLLADMDSTMIRQECIDELAVEAGIGEQVAAITARAMNGRLDFEEALIERVALLKGLEQSVIASVIAERITLTAGGKVLVATMRQHGSYTALVSGGFTEFTAPIGKTLGFDENRANELLIKNSVLTGEVGFPILGRAAKITALNDITAMRGLSAQDVIAVGDGANDLGMLRLAGMGVALHAKPSVAAECDLRIHHGDLTALLYLQGYSVAQFVDV